MDVIENNSNFKHYSNFVDFEYDKSFNKVDFEYRNSRDFCVAVVSYYCFDNSSYEISNRSFTYSASKPLLEQSDLVNAIKADLGGLNKTWFLSFALFSTDQKAGTHPNLQLVALPNESIRYDGGSFPLNKFDKLNYGCYAYVYDKNFVNAQGTYFIDSAGDYISEPVAGQWWEISEEDQRVVLESSGNVSIYQNSEKSFNSALDLIGTSLSGISTLLETRLIGDFTIGAVIAIPLSLTLIIWLVRALKK